MADPEPIAQARFEMRFGEYMRAAFVAFIRRGTTLLGLGFLLAVVLIGLAERHTWHTPFVILPLGFVFLGMPALMVSVWWLLYRNYRRMPAEHRELLWRFFPDHVEMSSATISSRVEWPALLGVLESAGILIFIFQSRRTAVVPKRALATAGELMALRQLLRDKLGKTARLAG